MNQQVSLYFTNGNSDKEYHAQLEASGDGFVVNFQYGRRGGTLKSGTKTKEPLTLEKAQKIYDKIIKEKTGKGYTTGEAGVKFQGNVDKKDSGIAPQLLNELKTEVELIQYINDNNFYAQEKFDGERRMAKKTFKETIGVNKKGVVVALTEDIANSITEASTLDAEQVGNQLYVFDLRSYKGKNLETKSYDERLNILEKASENFGDNISTVYTAKTKEEKQALLKELQENNREGIVFKHKDHQYKEGRPNSGGDVFKYKFYKTATVRVSAHTEGKRSVQMEMLDKGKVVSVGKVTIPSNKDIPEVGALVEARYLYAYKGGALYQPTYLGLRNDQNEEDIDIKQLVYKAE